MKRAPLFWLAAIVGSSFVVRTLVGWLRATPVLFPDEYIYSALGRSVAESGRPLIRGGSAHFPALLQPLVTAPAWLVDDVGTAFRIVQAIEAFAMSLAAIPVYLLARRLGLSTRVGLAVAALAVLVPDLVYSSFVSSEAFAYPLVLGAVAAATCAIAEPTRRSQLLFVALTGLACFARVQFAVLPVVFALAVVAVGVRERRVRAALREQLLPLAIFVLPLLVAIAAGSARTLGYYEDVLALQPDPIAMLEWMGWDAMALAYASGWIVVPGALLGFWLMLRAPQNRYESAVAAATGFLALALLLQAGLFQANPEGLTDSLSAVNGIKERYVFYLVPLVGLCFAVYARRGWPLRLAHLVVAAALFLVSVRVPLSGFAASATLDASPILYGVYWLGGRLDGISSASLAVAVAAALLLGVGVAASRRPALATPLVLALALFATAAASAGAVAFNVSTTAETKRAYLPRDPSFVDNAGLRGVALLQSAGGMRSAALPQLFWNRSVDRVLLLPGADRFDVFDSDKVTVAADGSMLVRGRPLDSPLLVDGFGSTVRLRGAREVASGPVSTLWAPVGAPRLAMYVTGRYHDGWLARRGAITVWPARTGTLRGRLSMTLSLPADMASVSLRFALPDGRKVDVRVPAGGETRVDFRICSPGPWRTTYKSNSLSFVGLRVVSSQASVPVFRPAAAPCANRVETRTVSRATRALA